MKIKTTRLARASCERCQHQKEDLNCNTKPRLTVGKEDLLQDRASTKTGPKPK